MSDATPTREQAEALEAIEEALTYAQGDPLHTVPLRVRNAGLAALDALAAAVSRLEQERDALQRQINESDFYPLATFRAEDREEAAVKEVASLREALRPLVTACEVAFAGQDMERFADDEDVSHPPTGLTFGVIRRAREALEGDGPPGQAHSGGLGLSAEAVAEVAEQASRIRLLAIEEEASVDFDDRIGCRHFREQAERDLGRFVATLAKNESKEDVMVAVDSTSLTIRVNAAAEITDADNDVIGSAFAAAEEAAKRVLRDTSFDVVAEYD